jgi:3-hydroxyacyl-CoA dehydrogenase
MREIKRVAVLGSGVMGGAIAAHLANCGIPSIMLDIVPPNLADADKQKKAKRNAIVDAAKAALLKAKPSPLYKTSNLDLIETGNFDDDMARISECDLIIEVVKEDLKIKHLVFGAAMKHRKKGAILSTNTSGIPIKEIATIMDAETKEHFLGTHFFNPPRYLKLLELIPLPETKPEVIDAVAKFGENILGKGIVYAKDTPNFIANRILTFAMQYTLHEMTKDGLSVEEVDALTGPAIGHANSATFRTADLVGLDTYLHVVGNVYNGCPNDERRDLMKGPEWVEKMVENGWYGSKSGQGFYKKSGQKDEKGKPIFQTINPDTLEYSDAGKARFDCTGAARGIDELDKKLKVMYMSEDKGSKFVFKQFANLAVYAGNRIPEIADDIVNIDNAVRWGFAWQVGIFETWDILGFKAVADRMKELGLELPPVAKALQESGGESFYKFDDAGTRLYFDVASKSYKPVPTNKNEISLGAMRRVTSNIVKKNDGATLFDLGDGILCCAFHTKMNSIDGDIIAMLHEAVDLCNNDKFDGLVVANQEDNFSVGANLMMVLGEVMQQNWDGVDQASKAFQDANMAMKYCSKPVVAGPHHFTFGGGLEICQHADKCVIAGETYAGLVEAGVGLIPAGGGTKEMLVRAFEYMPEGVEGIDPLPLLRRAFEAIGTAKVGTSGAEVVQLGYLRTSDIILPNFDHQVQRAKDVCLGLLTAGYRAPLPPKLVALGESLRAAIRSAVFQMRLAGFASEHDALIAEKLGNILTGGDRFPGTPVTEQDILDLEREAFCSLCGTEKTQQRMQHMLATGKPLRN